MASGRALFVDNAIEHLVCVGTAHNPCYLDIVGVLGDATQIGSLVATQTSYLHFCATRVPQHHTSVALQRHCIVGETRETAVEQELGAIRRVAHALGYQPAIDNVASARKLTPLP